MTKVQWCENLTLIQCKLEAEQVYKIGELAAEMAKMLKPLYETEKKSGKPILSESNRIRVYEIERERHPEIYYNLCDGETRIEVKKGRNGYEVRYCNWKEVQEWQPRKLCGETVHASIKSGWVTYGTAEKWQLSEAIKRFKILAAEYVSETLV